MLPEEANIKCLDLSRLFNRQYLYSHRTTAVRIFILQNVLKHPVYQCLRSSLCRNLFDLTSVPGLVYVQDGFDAH